MHDRSRDSRRLQQGLHKPNHARVLNSPELPAQPAELLLGDLRALNITHVLCIPPPAIILLLLLLLLVSLTKAVAKLQLGDPRVRAIADEILQRTACFQALISCHPCCSIGHAIETQLTMQWGIHSSSKMATFLHPLATEPHLARSSGGRWPRMLTKMSWPRSSNGSRIQAAAWLLTAHSRST